MKPGELYFSVEPAEDPDWGFARTKRLLLRRGNCEFSQSCLCVPLGSDGLVCPNRDYPYEGQSAVINGCNCKFLDGLAFGLCRPDGSAYQIVQQQVQACPWESVYRFSVLQEGKPAGTLTLSYYLMRNPNTPTLSVRATCDLPPASALLRVVPLADLRFMYAPSFPQATKVSAMDSGLQATNTTANLCLRLTASGVKSVTLDGQTVTWKYKLGSGERADGLAGITFLPEERQVVRMGQLLCAFSNRKVKIQCQCVPAGTQQGKPLHESRRHDEKAELLEQSRTLKTIAGTLAAAEGAWGKQQAAALAGRASVLLTKFDYSAAGFQFPDAGAYWFRNAWMRDAFEAAYTNFPLFMHSDKRRLRSWVVRCLQLSKDGLIPNKLPESPDQPLSYAGLDGTLLCFLVGLRYASATGDPKLKSMLRLKALEAITCFKKPESPVRLHDNGLLSCPAAYGWVDSYYPNPAGQKVPSRLPVSWAQKLAGQDSQGQPVAGKHYFLVETNALWMRFLQDIADLAGGEEGWAQDLVQLLQDNYLQTFWREGFLSHIADPTTGEAFTGNEGEGMQSSMAVQSAALLPEVLGKQNLASVLQGAKPLFAYRQDKLFGLLVRNSSQRRYYDDRQYHQAVVWPRDTPYLISLLNSQPAETKRELVQQLLVSNLEHQMQEGAVFYNQELFTLAEGNNPSPVESEKGFPVPVKNPAQLWSQWVQPYVDYFA